MARARLTTINNPHDPFEKFVEWYIHDTYVLKLNTSAYVARVANTSDQLSDQENEEEIERAIDEIIAYDFMNIYRKVKEKETIKEPTNS